MFPITESTRELTWQELLDVSRLVRYYSALARRYQWYHYATRAPLLLSALAGVASALDFLPEAGYVLASVIIALFVAVDFMGDFAKKAAVLNVITHECSELEAEAHRQWVLVAENQIDEEEAQRHNTDFHRKVSEVTAWSAIASIPDSERLNKQCARDSYQVIRGRYADAS